MSLFSLKELNTFEKRFYFAQLGICDDNVYSSYQ